MTAVGFVAIVGVLGFGGADSPEARMHVPDTLPASSVDVPFVAQGPLLCGGAAAAMVERFWGARGVYGEDFQALVREDEGGIRTSELTSAMVDRGYSVTSTTYEPDRVFEALERGIPPILLLESGVTRLHYVVLVAVEGERAWIHDPNFGPDRELASEELLRQWSASGYWALLVRPSETDTSAGRGGPTRSPTSAPAATSGSDGAVRDPAVLEAMERLRREDFAGARAAARALVERSGEEGALGRRIMATGWFLDGQPHRALAEWNALGEPVIDLVRIEGMHATRYLVAFDRVSLGHGELLTPASLALARRRLALLPAVEGSRVAYRPLPDGTVEVEARVLERDRFPGYHALATEGARGAVQGRAVLEAGPFMAAGDRWRLTGGWARAQRHVGGSVSTPAPPLPGIVTVGMEWWQERFAPEGVVPGEPTDVETEKRSRGWLEVEEWIHPRMRLGAALALESWDVPRWSPAEGGAPVRVFHGGLAAHWVTDDDRGWLTARGEGWSVPDRSFGRASLEAGATIPHGEGREWRLLAGGIAVSPEAPRTVWPGAGTGRFREPLLRAHGLVVDDLIQGPAFGRELVHGTIEHRFFRSAGPLRAGAALFVDAAHVGSRAGSAGKRAFVDVGGGLFWGLGSREAAVSLARGSSGWKLSARVEDRR